MDALADMGLPVDLRLCHVANSEHRRVWRFHAHTGHRKHTICLSHAFFDLPWRNQEGILWHEAGHVIAQAVGMDEPYVPQVAHWKQPREKIANALVCKIFGYKIRYDRKKLQVIV